jgi:hypothetical protein
MIYSDDGFSFVEVGDLTPTCFTLPGVALCSGSSHSIVVKGQ